MKSTLIILLAVASCQSVFAIIGGQNATIEEFPFLVRIKYNGALACHGAIVDSKHVITEDQCLSGKPNQYLTVEAGSASLRGGVSRGVVKTYRASTYNFREHMAVLKLSDELTFSKTIKPAKLAAPGAEIPKKLKTAGWGTTYFIELPHFPQPGPVSSVLKSLEVESYSRETCRDNLEFTGKYLYKDSEGCADSPILGKNLCYSDAGAPLVADDGVLYGVFNYVICGRPQVYSSISYFHDWILEQTKL